MTTSIIIGSVPAVLVGSLISSRAPDRYIRPVITFVIFASGLKYVGLGTTALGWMLGAVLLAGAVFWLAYVRPRRAGVGALAGDSTRSGSVTDGAQLEGGVTPDLARPRPGRRRLAAVRGCGSRASAAR